jgi:aryl-alcohol dehydrogenase-like predicted oxidoreductase
VSGGRHIEKYYTPIGYESRDDAGVSATWLTTSELRIGLGCMRLSTDADRDDDRATATIAAAAASGITVFDTARAYDDTSGSSPGRFARGVRRRPLAS